MNPTDTNRDKTPSLAEIKRAIKLLFEPAQVVELRAPDGGRGYGTVSGYYDNFETLAIDACRASKVRSFPAVWVSLQRINPELLARSANTYRRYAKEGTTTKDGEVLAFRWLFVDCDPKRLPGVSSTDAEKTAARAAADKVRSYFEELGYKMVLADSGNGYHVLVRIDLPVVDKDLVARALKSLAARFSDSAVEIDSAVYNPARMIKLYGTVSRKASDMPNRPHRLAQLVEVPDDLQVVPREVLEKIAGELKTESSKAAVTDEHVAQIEEFLTAAGVEHDSRQEHNGGWKWQLKACPFCGNSTSNPAVFVSDAGFGFHCFDTDCAEKHWTEFRVYAEDKSGVAFHSSSEERKVRARKLLEMKAESLYQQCPHESILFLELSTINAQLPATLSRRELRILSIEGWERLTGEQVDPEPGAFEEHEQLTVDAGFSKHFVRSYGGLVRYNPETCAWLIYRLGVWRVDENNVEVTQWLKEFSEQWVAQYVQILDQLRAKWEAIAHKFTKDGKPFKGAEITEQERIFAQAWFEIHNLMCHYRAGLSARQIHDGLELARTEHGIAMPSAAWDAAPLLFNAWNATINLVDDSIVADRRRAYLTKQSPIVYEPHASCPRWEKVLERSLPDATVREFLQDFVGIALTGLMVVEILIFLGEGANGKGLINRVLARLLGDYYSKVPISAFLQSKYVNPGGTRSDLASLRGKRLATAAEADRRNRLDMETLKDWVGGETVSPRELWQRAVHSQFKPQAKLILSMNKPPRVDDQTHAAWRRLRYIMFDVIIPEGERNDNLADELFEAEGPGILNWALAGWGRVRQRLQRGKPALVAPDAVLKATMEHKVEENHAGRFFEEKLVIKSGAEVSSGEVYGAYLRWCEENGERPTSSKQLTLLLRQYAHDKGLKAELGLNVGGRHVHRGVKLNEPF